MRGPFPFPPLRGELKGGVFLLHALRRAERAWLAARRLDSIDRARDFPAFVRFDEAESIDAAVAELAVSVEVVRRPEDGDGAVD